MNIKNESKYKLYLALCEIENFINHNILDHIFELLPMEDKSGNSTIFYKIWERTVYGLCLYVNVTLYEKLLMLEEDKNEI